MRKLAYALLAGACLVLAAAAQRPGAPRRLTVYLHGKPLAVRVYDPPLGSPRRPVNVTS